MRLQERDQAIEFFCTALHRYSKYSSSTIHNFRSCCKLIYEVALAQFAVLYALLGPILALQPIRVNPTIRIIQSSSLHSLTKPPQQPPHPPPQPPQQPQPFFPQHTPLCARLRRTRTHRPRRRPTPRNTTRNTLRQHTLTNTNRCPIHNRRRSRIKTATPQISRPSPRTRIKLLAPKAQLTNRRHPRRDIRIPGRIAELEDGDLFVADEIGRAAFVVTAGKGARAGEGRGSLSAGEGGELALEGRDVVVPV